MAQPLTLPRLDAWPPLPLNEWRDTKETLHMWTQVVGKVRMALAPPQNHWWHVTLYVSGNGLTTSPIPYGSRTFEVTFNFLDQQLNIVTGEGLRRTLPLAPRSVASFYREFMGALRSLGIQAQINPMPQEVPDPIPFDQDETHHSYDPEAALRFWRILSSCQRVFQGFRGRFLGKCSPVHFFWGSFDLAVTRFSGKRAPERPGADSMTQEAYSHEVISAGFWPGSDPVDYPAFYAYSVPEPQGFAEQKVRPASAFYHPELKEFLLRYDEVRLALSPESTLMEFLQSTYEAAAELARWDRLSLERQP